MADYCSVTLDQAPAHKCLCRRDQKHNSPHRCYCGHLWGDPFVEMSYDEQRAFLGLPRVDLIAGSYQLGKAYTERILDELMPQEEVWTTFAGLRSHGLGPAPVPASSPRDDLGKEIVIAADGLSIGGRRFPGVIAKDSLHVEPISETPGLWQVDLSLITTTPPRFIGTRLVDAGGCQLQMRSGRWECALDHEYHRDAQIIERLNGSKIGRT
ncbi:hypothetical protein L618_008000000030 [Rhodococcus rhodochrous J45]|uniref:Uncharacterized protein n=1 Tax=Rhodococcus rhodochrous J45 TaxID=935266 RepID=A0A562D7S0_RHORH|nr:hypothetical protein [Rhodococcus rhodochrous]TWH05592.1 hypothetical protein L618_008000000030 [Rhodococcus rhodochrous J45]